MTASEHWKLKVDSYLGIALTQIPSNTSYSHVAVLGMFVGVSLAIYSLVSRPMQDAFLCTRSKKITQKKVKIKKYSKNNLKHTSLFVSLNYPNTVRLSSKEISVAVFYD